MSFSKTPSVFGTVIISAGIGAFSPNKIERTNVEEFEGNGVFYFVKDKRPFRGKRLLIVADSGWATIEKPGFVRTAGAPIVAIPLGADCKPE